MFNFTLNPVTFAWILAIAGLVGGGIGLLLGLGILAWKEDKHSKGINRKESATVRVYAVGQGGGKPMAERIGRKMGRKRERGFTMVEAMIVAALLGIFAALVIPRIAPVFANDNRVSEGARVGELVKVTHKGIWFKTWEAELKLQEGGSGDSDNGRWAFTVPAGMASIAQSNLGKRVMVVYFEKGLQLDPRDGDTKYHAVRFVEREGAETARIRSIDGAVRARIVN